MEPVLMAQSHAGDTATEPVPAPVPPGDLAATREKGNRSLLIGFSLVLLAGSGMIYWARSAPDDERIFIEANTRICVCTETGRSFPHRAKAGEEEPIVSPFTGRRTAWTAEACYWTRDGRAKRTPTYVVLKERMGINERTICPDCGREVVGHNPLPPADLFKTAE
jgi:hypothetical protein